MANRNLGSLVATLELTTDKFQKGLADAQRQAKNSANYFTELNQSLELVSKGFDFITSSFSQFKQVVSRGQDVFELKNAFADLQAQAGQTADVGIKKLREATQGMLSDFELMRTSNVAASFGATQQQFEILAGSADKLGGAVGKSLPEALNILNEAFGRGKTKMMEQLGIKIQLTGEEEKYRKSLDQTGELLFNRSKILEAVVEKENNLSDAQNTTGDAMERFEATITNFKDTASEAVTKNEDLARVLDEVSASLNGVNGEKLIELLNSIILLGANAASALVHLRENFNWVFDSQTAGTETLLAPLVRDLDKINSMDGLSSFVASQKESLGQLQEKLNELVSENSPNGLTKLVVSLDAIGKNFTEAEKKEKLYAIALENAGDAGTYLTAKIKALEEAIDRAEKKQMGLASSSEDAGEAVSKEKTEAEKLKEELAKLRDGMKAHVDTTKDAEKAAKEHEKALKEQAKAVEKLNEDYRKTVEDVQKGKLNDALDEAFKNQDFAAIQSLKTQLATATKDGYIAGIKDAYDKADPASQALAQKTGDILAEASSEAIDKRVTESLKESFQNSVDFFSDIFTPMLEGEAANFEDIFKDAAKRIAIGFASNLAAAAAQSLGLNVAGFGGGAGGLGQALGQLITGQGTSTFANVFGGGTTQAAGATATQTAGAGAGAGTTTGGSGVAASGMSLAAGATTAAIAAYYAYFGTQSYKNMSDQETRDKGRIQAYLLSNPYTAALAAVVPGMRSANPEAMDRKRMRGALQDTGLGDSLSFTGVRGKTSLFGKDNYNVDFSNPLAGQAVSLTQGMADVFTGGNDKLGNDLAGIFSNAVLEADNFNEVLANTMSLMDQMGTNAQEQKDQLTSLFLEGKVSLDELNAGLAGLNIIAQDNLVGTGSVSDALKIVADNITDGPGTALKGLELALKEAAELGINDMGGLANYLSDKASPEVVAAFRAIQAAGINTFDDVQNASSDQIAAIFSALTTVQDQMVAAFSKATEEFSKTADQMVEDAQRAQDALNELDGGGNDITANQAKGGLWVGGVQKFAQGGYVDRPTLFSHAGGLGLMGEKGGEFIVPAARMADGSLGISGKGLGVVNVTYAIDARNASPGVEANIVRALKEVHQRAKADAVFEIQDMMARGIL